MDNKNFENTEPSDAQTDLELRTLFKSARQNNSFDENAFARKVSLRIENQKSRFTIIENLLQAIFIVFFLAILYLLPKSIGNINAIFADYQSLFNNNQEAIYFIIAIIGVGLLKLSKARGSLI